MSYPSILSFEPSIENCDPVALQRASTPGDFSLQENPVLYGGGRKWWLKSSQMQLLSRVIPPVGEDKVEVDIYVLSCALVIWFRAGDCGLQVPYGCVLEHLVTQDESKQLQLSMKIRCDDSNYMELSLIPMFGETDRYYNSSVEKLFTYANFGLNKGDKMVYNTFGAIAKCSTLHIEEDDMAGNDVYSEGHYLFDSMEQGSELSENDGYNNTGTADDMDVNYQLDNFGEACVDVDIYDGTRGVTRTRDECNSSQEIATPQKRVRC